MNKLGFAILCAACLGLNPLVARAQSLVVFSNSFDAELPQEIDPGAATLTGVQGYAGLGPVGYQFGGSFLRSPTGNPVTLTLSNLPPHTSLNLAMLFAAIDSLDGTGNFPSGDFFRVTLGTNGTNGVVFFRESFANATEGQIQSYVPPPGGELARRVNLGFAGPGGFYTDSAYNFAVDPRFSGLPHTGEVAVVTFLMEGPGIQPLSDESWAMDNLVVSLNGVPGMQPPVITRIQLLDNEVTLSWSAMTNRQYVVQTCTNLVNPIWTDVLPAVTATNISASSTKPRSGDIRFYRVRLLEP